MATGLEIAALVTAIIGTGNAIVQGERAQEEQEDAQSAQAAQEEINQRNERIKQVREQRVAVARAQQAAANIGVSGSSLESSAVGSANTQAASNIATLTGQENTSKAITDSLFTAQRAGTIASQVGAAAGLFNKLANSGAFSSKTQLTQQKTTPVTPTGPLE